MRTSEDITILLQEWSGGDQDALNRLIPLVYSELGRIAQQNLNRRGGCDTLMPSALVHEAYLRMCRSTPVNWNCRKHFYAVSAQLMRRILVDHSRARLAGKRAGGCSITLHEDFDPVQPGSPDLIDVDKALDELNALDPQQARVVELRFFTGLSVEETASVLNISTATVKRDWAVAKTWIRRRLQLSKAPD